MLKLSNYLDINTYLTLIFLYLERNIHMNVRYLTYFVEVAKEKNFTRAANNLHLSQPALSKVIKNLEIDLGISLIDRTAKNFKLTDQGEIFFTNAQNALENINSEFEQLYCSIDSTKGKLVVGIPPVIGTVYFASMIAKFKSKYPDIEFTMIEAGANNVKSKVNDSEVDIGVVILPAEDEGLNVIEIINSEIVLVINKEHKLAQKDNIYLNDLNGEGFITLNENYMIYDKLNLLFEDGGFDPNITYKSSQWDFVAEMVALNQGIAILPKPIVKRFNNENIKEVKIKDYKMPWDVALILKKDKYLSYGMKEFIKFVKEESIKFNEESI